MADYRFHSQWEFLAPIETLWREIGHPPPN